MYHQDEIVVSILYFSIGLREAKRGQVTSSRSETVSES